MADRIAIYDPDLQIGAIIDTDTMRALGPVAAGQNAKPELEAFIGAMPEIIWKLSTFELVEGFLQFWTEHFQALYEAPVASDGASLVEPAGSGDNGAALAEHTASATAGEPPATAPADADVDADQGTTPAVGPEDGPEDVSSGDQAAPGTVVESACFACGGAGTVPGSTDGEAQTCNLCKGTGYVSMMVPA